MVISAMIVVTKCGVEDGDGQQDGVEGEGNKTKQGSEVQFKTKVSSSVWLGREATAYWPKISIH